MLSILLMIAGEITALAGNRVIAWGDSTYGKTNTPSTATNVIAIAAGQFHSLALRADGTVLAWGRTGHTNVPPGLTNVVAIAAGRGQSLALKSDGSLVAWGTPSTVATTNIPPGLTNVVAIACGDNHNLVLRANGTVFAWGASYSGQTTLPPNLSNVVAIVAGNTGNLAVRENGTIWGSGAFTNLLHGNSNIVAGALVANGVYQGAVLRGNGTAEIWGYTATPTNLPGVVALVGRSGFNQAGSVWALRANRTLTGFGTNYLGQPAVYGTLTNVLAVAIGYDHHMAIIGDDFPIPAVSLGNSRFAQREFSVELSTIRGRSYFLQYKDSWVNGGGWQWLPPVPGTGGTNILVDRNANSAMRLYRVRVNP